MVMPGPAIPLAMQLPLPARFKPPNNLVLLPNAVQWSLMKSRLFTFSPRGARQSPISPYPSLLSTPLLVQYKLPLPSCRWKTKLKGDSTTTRPIGNTKKKERKKRYNWWRYEIYTLQSNEKICLVIKAIAPKMIVDIYNFLIQLLILCFLCFQPTPQLNEIPFIYLFI